jgi:ABC-type Mn2+/Zn2+ transport system permease subunit
VSHTYDRFSHRLSTMLVLAGSFGFATGLIGTFSKP